MTELLTTWWAWAAMALLSLLSAKARERRLNRAWGAAKRWAHREVKSAKAEAERAREWTKTVQGGDTWVTSWESTRAKAQAKGAVEQAKRWKAAWAAERAEVLRLRGGGR